MRLMDSDIDCKVDKLIQNKKPRFRKFWIVFGIAIGAFLVAFLLITTIVIPIFDDRRLSYLGVDDDIVTRNFLAKADELTKPRDMEKQKREKWK